MSKWEEFAFTMLTVYAFTLAILGMLGTWIYGWVTYWPEPIQDIGLFILTLTGTTAIAYAAMVAVRHIERK